MKILAILVLALAALAAWQHRRRAVERQRRERAALRASAAANFLRRN